MAARVAVIATWIIATFLCGLPLLLLFRLGLLPDVNGAGGMSVLADTLASRSVRRALWQSLYSSTVAAAIATFVGTLIALTLARSHVKARGVLVFLLLLPMMIPPHVTAIAWAQALGPNSSLLLWLGIAPAPGSSNPVYSAAGLMALLALQSLPITVLLVQTAIRQLPEELFDAARVSGAQSVRVIRRIILPLLRPTLVAAFTLSLIASLGNFGINALIGIPARFTTLPVLIWQRLSSFGPDVLPQLATLSAILAALALALVMLSWASIGYRSSSLSDSGSRIGATSRGLDGRQRPTAGEISLWVFIGITLVFPLLALFFSALVPTYGVPLTLTTLTFQHFKEILFEQSVTTRAFRNSTGVASLAAILIALLSILLAHFMSTASRLQQRFALSAAVQADLAYAVPGLVMSIAFILLFIKPLPVFNVSLYGTLLLIGLAYIAVFLAVGLKPVVAAATQLDPAQDEAARITGASFVHRLRRIKGPLLMPAAVSGAVLVFLTAYNEITVSALLWSAGNETIGTVIFNYEDGGYTTLAAAMAMITVCATVAIMLLMSRLGRHTPTGTVPWS